VMNDSFAQITRTNNYISSLKVGEIVKILNRFVYAVFAIAKF
jgi:hypothetical protein